MPSLSAILIAKNEEAHIGRALASLHGFADEIIVVDSESTDRTVDIARKFTENVFTRAFEGFGAQKNFARGFATGEWILHIDADEEISPELRDEIRSATEHARVDFFFLPIITEFLGRPLIHHGGKNLRLFRRTSGQWDTKRVHEQIERTRDHSTVRLGDEDAQLLTAPLTHHSHYATLKAYLERQERYTTSEAQHMQEAGEDRHGKSVTFPRTPAKRALFVSAPALKTFLKKFFLKKGILDGWQGWVWCFVSAQYEWKVRRKYLMLMENTDRTA